ncbi:hypothetical protein IAT40_007958 [Kwoniella sp. CBS 6097]
MSSYNLRSSTPRKFYHPPPRTEAPPQSDQNREQRRYRRDGWQIPPAKWLGEEGRHTSHKGTAPRGWEDWGMEDDEDGNSDSDKEDCGAGSESGHPSRERAARLPSDTLAIVLPSPSLSSDASLPAEIETGTMMDRSIEAARTLSSGLNEQYLRDNDLDPEEIASYLVDCSKKGCDYHLDRLNNLSENELLTYKNSEAYSRMIETYKRTGDRRCPSHVRSNPSTGTEAVTGGEGPRRRLDGFEQCGYTCTTDNRTNRKTLEQEGFMEPIMRRTRPPETTWLMRCTVDCPIHVYSRSDGTEVRTKLWTGQDMNGHPATFCSEYHAIDQALQAAMAPSDSDMEEGE